MAGNKMNSKGKTKDEKNKLNKNSGRAAEDDNDTDFAILRKPIMTSITGFAQARKIYDFATEELKSLLSTECDILYECKVCRNIFRSLANFISHKRVYCKEKFNSLQHGHFIQNASMISEIAKIKRSEEDYHTFMKNSSCKEKHDFEERIPMTKDLTTLIEKITKNKGVTLNGSNRVDNDIVTLQKISTSNVAVYQNIGTEETTRDDMRAQVNEIDSIMSNDTVTLKNDGTFSQPGHDGDTKSGPETVIQISDDDDDVDGDGINNALKCRICKLQFATSKTLKHHMKSKHVENRLVYPCPDCFDIFSNSWSVYRHLFKVHRKTAAQIRRLRESIQSKAFKMDNPPALYEKKKNVKVLPQQKMTEEERIEQENQAWMDNMESDAETPRCGGCGRTFERRAALAAHTHTCQPRTRALAGALNRRPVEFAPVKKHVESKKIEIQIRKDYIKAPTKSVSTGALSTSSTKEDAAIESKKDEVDLCGDDSEKDFEMKEEKDCEIEPEKDCKDKKDKVEDKKDNDSEDKTGNSETAVESDLKIKQEKQDTEAKENKNSECKNDKTLEIKREQESDVNVEKVILKERENSLSTKAESKVDENVIVKREKPLYPISEEIEKENVMAFKQKIAAETDFEQKLCKVCDETSPSLDKLYQHMAVHYKWRRYACKLCHFKDYDFEKLPEHLKTIHRLKGNNEFYVSTVKALKSDEASEIPDTVTPVKKTDSKIETSVARRSSRCSSESSRQSDNESVSSSSRYDSGSKRKTSLLSNLKRKREESKSKSSSPGNDEVETKRAGKGEVMAIDKVMKVIFGDVNDETAQMRKPDETDAEESDEKSLQKSRKRKPIEVISTRRPVRKRTRPKNEDFEYDLSNLLKMEAEAYRDSQTATTTTRIGPVKKKSQGDSSPSESTVSKELIVEPAKNYKGALIKMSEKAAEMSRAHLRVYVALHSQVITPRKFVRPLINPILAKTMPKPISTNRSSTDQDVTKKSDSPKANKSPVASPLKLEKVNENVIKSPTKEAVTPLENIDVPAKALVHLEQKDLPHPIQNGVSDKTESTDPDKAVATLLKTDQKNSDISAIVPIHLRRQSMEIIKNPLLNRKISDLTKAGKKTKILLIKPINRNKDAVADKTPFKFQTIKLKESIKDKQNNSADPAVLVKLPTIEAPIIKENITEPIPTPNSSSDKILDSEKSDQQLKKTENEEDSKVLSENESESNNTSIDTDITESDYPIEKLASDEDYSE